MHTHRIAYDRAIAFRETDILKRYIFKSHSEYIRSEKSLKRVSRRVGIPLISPLGNVFNGVEISVDFRAEYREISAEIVGYADKVNIVFEIISVLVLFVFLKHIEPFLRRGYRGGVHVGGNVSIYARSRHDYFRRTYRNGNYYSAFRYGRHALVETLEFNLFARLAVAVSVGQINFRVYRLRGFRSHRGEIFRFIREDIVLARIRRRNGDKAGRFRPFRFRGYRSRTLFFGDYSARRTYRGDFIVARSPTYRTNGSHRGGKAEYLVRFYGFSRFAEFYGNVYLFAFACRRGNRFRNAFARRSRYRFTVARPVAFLFTSDGSETDRKQDSQRD